MTARDSRVMTGYAAKGRGPSHGMNDDLKTAVPDYLGGDLSSATFWIESARCVANEPSRNSKGRRVAAPTEREKKVNGGGGSPSTPGGGAALEKRGTFTEAKTGRLV